MAEQKGHFEQGRWVADREPPAAVQKENAIDQRLSAATRSVVSSINDVMNVTRDLVTTEEGKQYIEKTLRDTQSQIQVTFDGIVSRLKEEMDKQARKGQ